MSTTFQLGYNCMLPLDYPSMLTQFGPRCFREDKRGIFTAVDPLSNAVAHLVLKGIPLNGSPMADYLQNGRSEGLFLHSLGLVDMREMLANQASGPLMFVVSSQLSDLPEILGIAPLKRPIKPLRFIGPNSQQCLADGKSKPSTLRLAERVDAYHLLSNTDALPSGITFEILGNLLSTVISAHFVVRA